MPLAVRTPAGLKDISAISARDRSGTLRTIQEAWVRTSVGLKQIFGKLSATASPITASGFKASGSTITVTTKTVTVTVAGGVAPLTHAWTQLTGGAWTIVYPGAAATAFQIDCAPGVHETGTFRDTITDATGATTTVDVTANANNAGGTL